jgi:hypothetical protein
MRYLLMVLDPPKVLGAAVDIVFVVVVPPLRE